MTTKQIKKEILKAIDGIPESTLQDILVLLKKLQKPSGTKVRLSKNLRKVLAEDKELLHRLAG